MKISIPETKIGLRFLCFYLPKNCEHAGYFVEEKKMGELNVWAASD